MKHYIFKILCIFIALFTFSFTSCDEEKQLVTELDFDSETFYANKAKWEEVKPSDYKFSYEVYVRHMSDENAIEVTSTVKNNEWNSFEYGVNFELLGADGLKDILDMLCIKTIDDYIDCFEKYYKELSATDFEKEQIDLYELKYYYHGEYFFPFSYGVKKSGKNISSIPMYIPIGESVFVSCGIDDFEVLPAEQVK